METAALNTTSPVASLSRVTVSFGGRTAAAATILRDFSLDVQPGEFLVIVGRSGCGKTTVLNLLSGLLDANAGSAKVMGKPPRDARNHLGYMFARDALVPSRTALGNVEIGLEVRGVGRAERRARADSDDATRPRRRGGALSVATLARHAPAGGAGAYLGARSGPDLDG